MTGRGNFNGCVLVFMFICRLVRLKERGQNFAIIVGDRLEGRSVEVFWDLEVRNHPVLDLEPRLASRCMVECLCVALGD